MQSVTGLATVNGKAGNKANSPWYYSGTKDGHVYLNSHSLPLTFFDNIKIDSMTITLIGADVEIAILFFNADERFALLEEYKVATV